MGAEDQRRPRLSGLDGRVGAAVGAPALAAPP
jgi:hypothetical protein